MELIGNQETLEMGGSFRVEFPSDHHDELDQDREWCMVTTADGTRRKLRFHDYDEIYSIPGLYEHLFYEKLKCDSPRIVSDLLLREAEHEGLAAEDMRILDIGAGNGMMGESLVERGVDHVVGVDIIPEAEVALKRDRPGIYADYHVADLTRLATAQKLGLAANRFQCMTSVAALGYGDIPPVAFGEACNLVAPDGWVAFTIKETFLEESDSTGFSTFIRRAVASGALEIRVKQRYRHRYSVAGEPLYYTAVIASKRGPLDSCLIPSR